MFSTDHDSDTICSHPATIAHISQRSSARISTLQLRVLVGVALDTNAFRIFNNIPVRGAHICRYNTSNFMTTSPCSASKVSADGKSELFLVKSIP